MSNPVSTINNPFCQGGWINNWHAEAAETKTKSPIPSNVESGTEFQPLQSSYGTLPLSTSSGVVLTPVDDQYSTLRFVSRESPANIVVLSSNLSTVYQVQSGALISTIKDHLNQRLATLHWHRESMPTIECKGQRLQIYDWMKPVTGTK